MAAMVEMGSKVEEETAAKTEASMEACGEVTLAVGLGERAAALVEVLLAATVAAFAGETPADGWAASRVVLAEVRTAASWAVPTVALKVARKVAMAAVAEEVGAMPEVEKAAGAKDHEQSAS